MTFRCDACERDFASEDGLQQHARDKHGVGGAVSKHDARQLRKHERAQEQERETRKTSRSKLVRRSAYVAVPVIIAAVAFIVFSSQPPATGRVVAAEGLPDGPIHWHPQLEIVIRGEQYPIPINLGLGAAHFPVHTHTEGDGTLHYEVNNPTPENMALGYFFDKVWRKRFNATCILDYCAGGGESLTMFVNGQENFEYEMYVPHDKDKIRIEFT